MPRVQPDNEFLEESIPLFRKVLNRAPCPVTMDTTFRGENYPEDTPGKELAWSLDDFSFFINLTPAVGLRRGKPVLLCFLSRYNNMGQEEEIDVPYFEALESNGEVHFPKGLVDFCKTLAAKSITSESVSRAYEESYGKTWQNDPALEDDQVLDMQAVMKSLGGKPFKSSLLQ